MQQHEISNLWLFAWVPYHAKEKPFQTRNYSTSEVSSRNQYMNDLASFSLIERVNFVGNDWRPVTSLVQHHKANPKQSCNNNLIFMLMWRGHLT